MRFGLIGLLEVAGDDGRKVMIGRGKESALLAILLLHANEPVSTDRLIDELLGDPSPTAAKSVQIYVSRLRKSLGESRLTTTAAGYVLRVEPGECDVDRFDRLVVDGRRALGAGDFGAASELLNQALGLWRGEPLAEFKFEQFAHAEIRRLGELRAALRADLVDARLELDEATGAVAELEELIAENPLWERPRAQLMLALYRLGRQAEALEVYRTTRTHLADELGIEPTPELQTLQRAILNHDPHLKRAAIRPRATVTSSRGPQPDSNIGLKAWRPSSLVIAGAFLLLLAAVGAAAVEFTGGSSSVSAFPGADSVGVYDAHSADLIAQASVPTGPTSLAVGAGSVWVADLDSDSVSRISLQTDSVTQTITVQQAPSALAVGDGFVWAANSLGGTVSKIDPNANGGTGGVVDTIKVGNGPTGIAFGAGKVWVANSTDRSVTEIDPLTDKALPAIPVSAGADGVAVGDGGVWVTSESDGSVTRIDPRSRIVAQPINVGRGANAVAVGAGAVWVANSLDGTVSRIDPRSNIVTATVPVGSGPSGIAVAANGETIWVSNEQSGSLSRIDPTRNKLVRTVTTGNRPEDVAMIGKTLYVAVRASGLAHRGGRLTVLAAPTTFDSIDPATAYTPAAWSAVILTNDGLLTFKRAGGSDGTRLVPDLATTIPTPTDGGTTYTFQVRRGIDYSDGSPLEPADFRRGIERSVVANASRGVGTGFYFSNIVGYAGCVKAPSRCDLSRGIVVDPNSYTVTFHLSAPDPEFLEQLALPAGDAVPSGTPESARLPLPATGPYMVASYKPSRELVLVRNPHFHEWYDAAQPDGYPSKIVWRLNVLPTKQRRLVEQGSADVANDAGSADKGVFPPTSVLATLQTRYASQLHTNGQIQTKYLFLNTRVPPFDNLKARQAVNYAVDRERFVDLQGGSVLERPTCQPLPPNVNGYQPYCPYTIRPSRGGSYTGPDLQTARRLVAESGTKGEKVTVAGPAGIFQLHGGNYLVSVLDSLGYKARFENISGKGKVGAQDRYFEIAGDSSQGIQAGIAGWFSDYPAAGDFLPPLLTCNSFIPRAKDNANLAEFCNPRIDAEIARARSLEVGDPATAAAIWKAVDHTLVNQAPWVPLENQLEVTLVSRRVGNYQYNPQWGVLLDQLWVS